MSQCAYPYCVEQGRWEMTVHVPSRSVRSKKTERVSAINRVAELTKSIVPMQVHVKADGLFCDLHMTPIAGKKVLGITAREQLEEFFEQKLSEPDFEMAVFTFDLAKGAKWP